MAAPLLTTFAAPLLALLVAVVTLALILIRPRRLPEPAAAVGGAVAMVLLGLASPVQAVGAVAASWNVLLFFVGLMVASFAAERAGVFDVAAHVVARVAGGSARRLLVWVYLLGVAVTTFLSNDATALLLTPVVFTLARKLALPPLPYAYACALSANAASFTLPVANPANLLVLQGAPMPLLTFVERLWLPSVVSAGVTLCVLLALTWTTLGHAYSTPAPDPVGRRASLGALGLGALVAGYLLSDVLHVPLGVVACLGGALLLALDGFSARLHPGALGREISWGVIVMLAGLTIVVEGLVQSGVTDPAAHALALLAELPNYGLAVVAVATAVLSNIINNLPMALITAAALGQIAQEAAQYLAAGVIVGIDLGPNLTTVGSFATLLWLMLLRRRGLDISGRAYARVGFIVTGPALLATILIVVIQG